MKEESKVNIRQSITEISKKVEEIQGILLTINETAKNNGEEIEQFREDLDYAIGRQQEYQEEHQQKYPYPKHTWFKTIVVILLVLLVFVFY